MHTVEDGEHIVVPKNRDREIADPLEAVTVKDLGAVISVTGYSHLTGENATYFVDPFVDVEIWEA